MIRGIVVCAFAAWIGADARHALAQCRCVGGEASISANSREKSVWGSRSGGYRFYAESTKSWYYWEPGQLAWLPVEQRPQAVKPGVLHVTAIPGSVRPPEQSRQPGLSSDVLQIRPLPALPYGGQRSCPVMDRALDCHGTPIPVQTRGQTIFVCCRDCVKQVQDRPDEYLAKVAEDRERSAIGRR